MITHVTFTGTQRGLTSVQSIALEELLRSLLVGRRAELGPFNWHSGDCIGADHEALKLVRQIREGLDTGVVWTVGHPSTVSEKRAWDYYDERRSPDGPLTRNHAMVDAADLVIAAPGEAQEVLRSGTWATVRYARKWGKPVVVVWPDGTVEKS